MNYDEEYTLDDNDEDIPSDEEPVHTPAVRAPVNSPSKRPTVGDSDDGEEGGNKSEALGEEENEGVETADSENYLRERQKRKRLRKRRGEAHEESEEEEEGERGSDSDSGDGPYTYRAPRRTQRVEEDPNLSDPLSAEGSDYHSWDGSDTEIRSIVEHPKYLYMSGRDCEEDEPVNLNSPPPPPSDVQVGKPFDDEIMVEDGEDISSDAEEVHTVALKFPMLDREALAAARQKIRELTRAGKRLLESTYHCALDGVIAALSGAEDLLPADVNYHGSNGNTALIIASAQGSLEIVEYLFQQPTLKINATNNKGQTALRCACWFRQWIVVERLLRREDLDINVRESGAHLLRWANYKVAKMVLKRRPEALVNVADSNGWTPLYLACSKNHTEFSRTLMRWPRIELGDMSHAKEMVALQRAAYSVSLKSVRIFFIHQLFCKPAARQKDASSVREDTSRRRRGVWMRKRKIKWGGWN